MKRVPLITEGKLAASGERVHSRRIGAGGFA